MSDSTPQVTLVDIDGRPITPPAASWPAWTDQDRWVPTPEAHDAPASDQVEDDPRRQVSPIELAQLAAHGTI
jgi:hypothetical protein